MPKLPTPQHPPPPKPQNDLSAAPPPVPGAEKATTTTNTINITLKSNRNPSMTYTLPSTPPSTTIASLKEQLHTYLGGSSVTSIEKIKILLNKKPVPPSKTTVAELVDTDTKDLELGVMVMGGAPDPPPQQSTAVKSRVPEAGGPESENAATEAETGVNPGDVAATPMEGVQATTAETGSEPVQPGEVSGTDVLQSQEFWNDLEGFLAQRTKSEEEAKKLRGMFEAAWRSNTSAP